MNNGNGVTTMITPGEKSLVGKIASKVFRQYCPAGVDGRLEYDELFNLGIIGLLEAKSRYDPARGIPFNVYASSRIRGAMLDQIRQQPIIRTSQELAQKIKKLRKVREEFVQKEQVVNDRVLAEKLGWTLEEIQKISNQFVHMVAARDNFEDQNDDFRNYPGEIIVENGLDTEHMVMVKELGDAVEKCLKTMPSDEYRLVLLGRVLEDLSLKELAEVLSCSIQTVANRQEKAQELMRKCLENKGYSLEALYEIQN